MTMFRVTTDAGKQYELDAPDFRAAVAQATEQQQAELPGREVRVTSLWSCVGGIWRSSDILLDEL